MVTTASAPITAGAYALAGPPVPRTYPAAYPYLRRWALYDITTGSNGTCSPAYLCTAEVGYDGPTGLGTPRGIAAFGLRAVALTGNRVGGGAQVQG